MSDKRLLKDLTEDERDQLSKEIAIYTTAIDQKLKDILAKYNLKVEAEILLKDLET